MQVINNFGGLLFWEEAASSSSWYIGLGTVGNALVGEIKFFLLLFVEGRE